MVLNTSPSHPGICCRDHFNPFHVTGLFLYPLKISENLWVSRGEEVAVRETPTQVFSCEIFSSTDFEEHLETAASIDINLQFPSLFKSATLNINTIL